MSVCLEAGACVSAGFWSESVRPVTRLIRRKSMYVCMCVCLYGVLRTEYVRGMLLA